MKYLTLEHIKAQLRIDDEQAEMERDLLELYGESAEESVLEYIRRSLIDVIVTYNGIPKRIVQASLLLVSEWYKHREPVEGMSLSVVSYTFDFLIRPFMRLAGDEPTPDWEDKLPDGAIVSSDGHVLMDKNYRIVCATAL